MIEITYNCNYFLSNIISLKVSVILSVFILVLFAVLYIPSLRKSKLGDIGFLLILLGGLSNLYEWVKYACVRDYINFFNIFHFNFADIMVTIGVVFVLITIWKKKLE